MKDTHFLYSIATLALGSIIAIFVSYATNTLPTHGQRDSTPAIATTSETKNCGCCTKITPQELKALRQRSEKLREHMKAYKHASDILKQFGIEEGIQKLKDSHPEIATQLERQLYNNMK